MKPFSRTALAVALVAALGGATAPPAARAADPQRGGILTYVVASEVPSYDLHAETTFGVIHPIAPFYSLLIRVNPDNPGRSDDFVCDLCVGTVPAPTDDGKTYTFKVREDVRFHDGTPLSAADVKATFDKIIFPPQGVASARKTQLSMVESVESPDATTVVFRLKYPSGAFLPALATPFNAIYSKKDLDEHGMQWHAKNINGSGPFMFVTEQAGAFVEGKRYPGYHHKGADGQPLPYLDGFKAIQAPKEAVRVQAIRGNRAAIEFRGLPPSSRDDLKRALGDRITVQESDWNCVLLVTPNHTRKPFDDPRVRRALTLALDRYEGSQYLSKIAIVRTVGGVVFPNHPLAATKEELQSMAGYWPDIEKSRAEARRLLAEAGVPDLSFTFNNRGVDQPYKPVGVWAIDQWSKVGMKVTQKVQPTGPFYDTLRKTKDFDVSADFNCQSVVNPLSDVSKFIGGSGDNYGYYKDPMLEELYDQMNREGDFAKQRELMRRYERRVLDEEAHELITLWWYRIIPHRSFVQGWTISSSHYLNQQLDGVWIDKSKM
ncbi:MAG: ABC transporter substrate-binding protein [Ectothiorhodospiraceae bacterium]|nr:ABC transporter substrate-binding protein [Chromatiales bacterium]MCP5154905.1 ABC transporter substrate-binding protein [Ectothiorhodospiraceae bacterium]